MWPTMEEVGMEQAIALSSERVILAAEATKVSQRSTVRSISLMHVDLLVTDLNPVEPSLDPSRDIVEPRQLACAPFSRALAF